MNKSGSFGVENQREKERNRNTLVAEGLGEETKSERKRKSLWPK